MTTTATEFDDYAELQDRSCVRVVSFAELARILANDVHQSPSRIGAVLAREGKTEAKLRETVAALRRGTLT